MMEFLLGANAFVFLLLFAIWTKKGLLNFLLKIFFLGLGIANGLVFLSALGYIVKSTTG